MAELDGVWDVQRLSGVLPPLIGVRKRIAGRRGETRVGVVGVPFDVEGLRLRYRGPLWGFVDILEPDEAGYRGRATYRGRQLGRFLMRRAEGDPAATPSV